MATKEIAARGNRQDVCHSLLRALARATAPIRWRVPACSRLESEAEIQVRLAVTAANGSAQLGADARDRRAHASRVAARRGHAKDERFVARVSTIGLRRARPFRKRALPLEVDADTVGCGDAVVLVHLMIAAASLEAGVVRAGEQLGFGLAGALRCNAVLLPTVEVGGAVRATGAVADRRRQRARAALRDVDAIGMCLALTRITLAVTAADEASGIRLAVAGRARSGHRLAAALHVDRPLAGIGEVTVRIARAVRIPLASRAARAARGFGWRSRARVSTSGETQSPRR